MQIHKKVVSIGLALIITVIFLAGCNSPAKSVSMSREEWEKRLQEARTTSFGAYPETINYTLGKMTSTNMSNMPEGDTYEDNAYTRYIKSVINVQNQDVFEEIDKQYDTNVSMAIAMGNLPDIMLVSDYDELTALVENDMIEDLTDSYKNCITDRIKDMYASYGSKQSFGVSRKCCGGKRGKSRLAAVSGCDR